MQLRRHHVHLSTYERYAACWVESQKTLWAFSAMYENDHLLATFRFEIKTLAPADTMIGSERHAGIRLLPRQRPRCRAMFNTIESFV